MKRQVFLSATCYDLADARAQIEQARIDEGYEVLLSDRSGFPVDSWLHRYDVCVENARIADGMIVWIDRRFGAPYDNKDNAISVTWETRAALDAHVPMVVFVRESIWNERLTFNVNGGDPSKFKPAFVDDCRTFHCSVRSRGSTRGSGCSRWRTRRKPLHSCKGGASTAATTSPTRAQRWSRRRSVI